MAVEKRFLKYVSYWTTSEDDQESIPSTKRQFELAKVLEQELKELNLEKVKLDEHCYVYGLLPASYRNMNEIIREHMEIIEIAKEAIRENGIEPTPDPIRGGTDGATLSHKGLPCPNLGTGGYAYHGPMEHVTVEGMETVVRIIKKISEKVTAL